MKALATSQVILLVLAIIVLAVIAYLVYTQYIAGSNQFGNTNCQSAIVSACANCRTCLTGFGHTWGADPNNCPNKGGFDSCNSLCKLPGCVTQPLSSCTAGTDKLVDYIECSSVGAG